MSAVYTVATWEFPKMRGILVLQQGSYYLGYYIRVPYLRKPPRIQQALR